MDKVSFGSPTGGIHVAVTALSKRQKSLRSIAGSKNSKGLMQVLWGLLPNVGAVCQCESIGVQRKKSCHLLYVLPLSSSQGLTLTQAQRSDSQCCRVARVTPW
jgi:hypothetical protein